MKLTAAELAHVCSEGLHVTEKCYGCGTLLNQTCRYTIAGRPEIYCSGSCRDAAFFGDRRRAKKQATPGNCDAACQKADSRKGGSSPNEATRKLADTVLVESSTCADADRQLGVSLVPTASAAVRGTDRDTTTQKLLDSGLDSLPKGQQTFDFLQSDVRSIQRRSTKTLGGKRGDDAGLGALGQAVVGNTSRRSDRSDSLTLFPQEEMPRRPGRGHDRGGV